jgi:hypothetical protein
VNAGAVGVAEVSLVSAGPSLGNDADPAASLRVLFLDDDPCRAREFLAQYPEAVWVQTAAECTGMLAETWDQVHLDHDLGGEIFVDSSREDCGMEVVRWLCREDRPALRGSALFVVHTHNMNAAGAMVRSLQEAGYLTVYRPFGLDLERWLADRDDEDENEDEDNEDASNGVEACGQTSEPQSRSPRRFCPGWLGRLVDRLVRSRGRFRVPR